MCPITNKVIRTFHRCKTNRPVFGDMHFVTEDLCILRVNGVHVAYRASRGEAIAAIKKLIRSLKG